MEEAKYITEVDNIEGTYSWPDGSVMRYEICDRTLWVSGTLGDGPITLDTDAPFDTIRFRTDVKAIGASNFSGWSQLKKVDMYLTGITHIGDEAFANCKKLRRILTGENLVSVGNGAFINCQSLQYIDFPGSLRTIGDQAFMGCDKLRIAVLPPSYYVTIGANAIGKDVEKVDIPYRNEKMAKIVVGEIRPNTYNDYCGCTVDIHITVYSYDFSKKYSFWLLDQDTGWTGESIMDGIYEYELEENADFDEDMNLCDIYSEEELEEMAWDQIMDGYEFDPECCSFLDYIYKIDEVLRNKAAVLDQFDDDADVVDNDIDVLLKMYSYDAWSEVELEDLIDFESMSEEDESYDHKGWRPEYYAEELVEDFEMGTVYEDKERKPIKSLVVPDVAIDFCKEHPAECLILPYAVCKGILGTHFVQSRQILRHISDILEETDWTDQGKAVEGLLSIRKHILNSLKNRARWVDIDNRHFSRYEYCSGEVDESGEILRNLCKVLETLCPKTSYGLAPTGQFEFTVDRSGDIRRLKDEHNLVIPEKIAYDFLVGTELREKYSKEIFHQSADYYDSEEYHKSRLAFIRDEVFSIIENKYLKEEKLGGMFDASLTLKEYKDETFVEQLLAAESEDDFLEDDEEEGTHVSHGIRYSCADYAYMDGEMVNENPGYMSVVNNEDLPYRDTVHIPSSVVSLGKTYPVESIDYEAFSYCDGLKRVIIDEGVKKISEKAFSGCSNLMEISLPASLEELEDSCFEGCSSLKSIFIPVGVVEMDISCFDGCKELSEINVDEANPVYKSVNGALYDRQSGQLIFIPVANESKGRTTAPLSGAVIEEGHGIFSVNGIRYGLTDEYIQVNTGELKKIEALRILPLNERLKYAGKLVIPDRVKYHNRWLEVVSWDRFAFKDCPELLEICLPATIRKAWFERIEGSPKLAAINVDAANEAFTSVNGILYNKAGSEIVCVPDGYGDSIILPLTVKTIGRAFENNTNLKNITLPDGLEKFYWGAFSGCSTLQEICIPGSVKCVPNGCFDGCSSLRSVTFGDGVKSIQDSAFGNCLSLKEIVFPESIDEVEREAFKGCMGLEKIVFPKGRYFDLTGIPKVLLPWGQDPFEMDGVLYAPSHEYKSNEALLVVLSPEKDAPALAQQPEVEELFIPAEIERNGFTYKVSRCDCAFEQFPNLHVLHLPDSMRHVNLKRIPSLRQVIVSENNETLASEDGILYNKDKTLLMGVPRGLRIKRLIVPDGVEIIGTKQGAMSHEDTLLEDIFAGREELEEVILPDSVKVIGEGSFRNCTSLRTVKLGEGLEEIYSRAFSNTALERITLPRSLKYVGQKEFSGPRPFSECSRLAAFEMEGEGELLKVIDGVLYQKTDNGLVLIYCPPAYSGTLAIPEGVVSIGNHACTMCEEIVRVEMPDSVRRISSWAFAGCTKLEHVQLSRELQYVESCAFRECTGLKEMDFTVCENYFCHDDFDTSAFQYCDGIKLKLPKSLEDRREYIERDIKHRVTAAELDATDWM